MSMKTTIQSGTQLALVAAIVWLTAGPSAQGLGDIARQEAARRQQVNAGKKYTNDDLRADVASVPLQPVAPVATAVPTDTAEKKPAAAEATPGTGEAAIAPAKEKRDEKYWRDRSGALRVKLSESREKVKAIQQRLMQLEEALAKGAGSSHTQERAVTLTALTEAQTDERYMKEEWARMEDRARAANIPPEWLK